MSSVHEMDCLKEETVPVSGRFGAQCSVASTRRQQFKEGVCWMWWGPEWFCQLTLDKYSSWRVGRVVPMIRSAVRTTLRSLLWSDLVAEMNQTVIDGFNDGRVELFQQLMWQVEIPQLAKDVQPLLGPFSQWTQCDCPTSGPEKLWCPGIWMTALQSQCCSWWWVGESRGVSPEVHDHLHCFEHVKLQVVKTVTTINYCNQSKKCINVICRFLVTYETDCLCMLMHYIF